MVFLVLVSAFSPIGDLTTFTHDCRTRNSIVSGLSSITATVPANLDPSAKGASISASASTDTAYLSDLLGPTTVRTLRHRQPVRRPSEIRWANRPQTEVISITFSHRRLPSDHISIQSHPCITTNSPPRHRHDRQHGSDPSYLFTRLCRLMAAKTI
jgi:hypothetical protein